MSDRQTRPAALLWLAASLALALVTPATLEGATAPGPSVRLTPDAVRMGAFYAGATVRIEGETPPGTTVLIVLRGPEEAQFLNRKGRVGPVWLSVDKVHITHVPSLFIRLGGGDVRSLLDKRTVESYQLDEAAIEHRMDIRGHCKCPQLDSGEGGSEPAPRCATGIDLDADQAALVRSGYLKLKNQEGTYRVLPEAVRVTASPEGAGSYVAEMDWPRRARPGAYRVEVLACREGAVVGQTSAELRVVPTGIPARIGALAKSHSTAYGALAVVAAVITGLAIDTLVRRRRPSRAARGPRTPPPPAPRRPEAAPSPAAKETAEVDEELATSRRG